MALLGPAIARMLTPEEGFKEQCGSLWPQSAIPQPRRAVHTALSGGRGDPNDFAEDLPSPAQGRGTPRRSREARGGGSKAREMPLCEPHWP